MLSLRQNMPLAADIFPDDTEPPGALCFDIQHTIFHIFAAATHRLSALYSDMPQKAV
jgi:hypothetical protein